MPIAAASVTTEEKPHGVRIDSGHAASAPPDSAFPTRASSFVALSTMTRQPVRQSPAMERGAVDERASGPLPRSRSSSTTPGFIVAAAVRMPSRLREACRCASSPSERR